MKLLKTFLWGTLAVTAACKSDPEQQEEENPSQMSTMVEVQGHRGDRGNFPENSIPAFKSAVRKGVEVLELDVVISRDNQVVVSHEPYMSSLYMLTPAGDSISKEDERSYNLYTMSYDSIKKFDAGLKPNKHFPDQQNASTYKPLLSEVIDSVAPLIAQEGTASVRYNVELKSKESDYGIYQPEPEEFVDLVVEVLREKNVLDRTNIQSFDVNILNLTRRKYPELELAYLVSGEGIENNLSLLDFVPEIYSPHYGLVVDDQFRDSVRGKNMRLIPWTVNDTAAIRKMITLGVDGIITDYPERVLRLRKSQ